MNRTYISLDLGQKGAICILPADSETPMTYPMPLIGKQIDLHKIRQILMTSPYSNPLVVFEQLGQIWESTKATAFSMGEQSGMIRGLCVGLGLAFQPIQAKEWQREMFTGVEEIVKCKKKKNKKTGETESKTSRDTKAMALVAVKRLYPDLKLTFGTVATKPHDGLVDSVLLAVYSKRRNL